MAEGHPRTKAVLDRVAAVADHDGRLALPDVAGWDIVPFEGDILVRRLEAPVLPEPPRHGVDGVERGPRVCCRCVARRYRTGPTPCRPCRRTSGAPCSVNSRRSWSPSLAVARWSHPPPSTET